MAVVYFVAFVAVLGGMIYGAIVLYERWEIRCAAAGGDEVTTPPAADVDRADDSILLAPGYQHSPSRGVSVSTEYHIDV